MSAPYEIVFASLTAYVAPVGTAFPALDAAPSGSWGLIGTSGNKNYDDPGVTVTHGQTIVGFTGAGGTVQRKVARTNETLTAAFQLADLSPAAYASSLDAALTTVAAGNSQAGEKHFEVIRGVSVQTHALLLRGPSTVDDTLVLQFEMAACYQAGNPAPVFSKGAQSMLALEYDMLEATAGVGCTVRIQTAPHT